MTERKSAAFLFLTVSLLVSGCQSIAEAQILPEDNRITPVAFLGNEFIAGWNLGNSLDVHDNALRGMNPGDFETFWGNPLTTSSLIRAVKRGGFTAVRIPVTWYMHMDRDYRVSNRWMNRVREVVDYCMANDLFVILNAHHENWYDPRGENMKQALAIMETLWTQIGRRFEGYGDRLLFEGMNEPRLRGDPHEWNEGTRAARKNINLLNKAFVDTIRGLGGNNRNRLLLVPTYCASYETAAIEDLDTSWFDSRVMVSIHLYAPYDFTLDEHGTSRWYTGNSSDSGGLNRIFGALERTFIRKGIPVAITEFGAVDKKNESRRIAWARYVTDKAASLRIPCFWWDNGSRSSSNTRFALINRRSRSWYFPALVSVLTDPR